MLSQVHPVSHPVSQGISQAKGNMLTKQKNRFNSTTRMGISPRSPQNLKNHRIRFFRNNSLPIMQVLFGYFFQVLEFFGFLKRK